MDSFFNASKCVDAPTEWSRYDPASFTVITKAEKKTQFINVLGSIQERPDWGISEEEVKNDIEGAIRKIQVKQDMAVQQALRRMMKADTIRIVFVMDATGSMGAHLEGVKSQIRNIVDMFQESHAAAGEQQRGGQKQGHSLKVGYVAYKDHCDCDRLEVFQPADDIEEFQSRVARITADGGGDLPEDVIGGLATAVDRINWDPEYTNVLFHMGDTPPHGSQYNGSNSYGDDYPSGHPKDKSVEYVFDRMKQQNIRYYFGKITKYTDKMVEIFSTAYGDRIEPFDVTQPIDIATSVVSAVTASLSINQEKSKCLSGAAASVKPAWTIFSHEEPSWDSLPVRQGSILWYDHCKEVDKIQRGDFKVSHRPAMFQIAEVPFARGSERAAFFAKEYLRDGVRGDLTTEQVKALKCNAMVVKKFLRVVAGDDGARYMKSIEAQSAAASLAMLFNKRLGDSRTMRDLTKLKFLKTKCFRIGQGEHGSAPPYQYYAIERRFRDRDAEKFIKLTNNWKYVRSGASSTGSDSTASDEAKIDDCVELAEAFSHFSWAITNKFMMIVDLQGQYDHGVNTLLLTDPAIHCVQQYRFSTGCNMGSDGMNMFFEVHKCNKYCRVLEIDDAAVKAAAAPDRVFSSGRGSTGGSSAHGSSTGGSSRCSSTDPR